MQFLELMDVQGPWWWRLFVRFFIVKVVVPILKLAATTNGNKICRGISFAQSLIDLFGLLRFVNHDSEWNRMRNTSI